MTAVSFGAEVTNPVLQFRWFLREHNQYETTVIFHTLIKTFILSYFEFSKLAMIIVDTVQCTYTQLEASISYTEFSVATK